MKKEGTSYNKKYYEANKEKIKEQKRQWALKNPEKQREANRKYKRKVAEQKRLKGEKVSEKEVIRGVNFIDTIEQIKECLNCYFPECINCVTLINKKKKSE